MENLNEFIDFFSLDENWEVKGFGALCGAANSGNRDAKEIEQQIRESLSGCQAGLRWHDLFKTRNFLIEENVVDPGRHKNAIFFLNVLFYFGIRLNHYTCNRSQWEKARDMVRSLVALTHYEDPDIPDRELEAKGCAVRYLRKQGYDIPADSGEFTLSQADIEKFASAMRGLFAEFGKDGIDLVLEGMRKFYSPEIGRYCFRQPPPLPSQKPELQIPWGYLLNVALSFAGSTNEGCGGERKAEVLTEVCQISRCFFSVMGLQVLSSIGNALRAIDENVDEIMENILFQQFVALDQIPAGELLEILIGLSDALPYADATKGCVASRYIDILRWVVDRAKAPSVLRLATADVQTALNHYHKDDVTQTMSALSQSASSINVGYAKPFDKRNYFLRPFIRDDAGYEMISPPLAAKGFFHAWLRDCTNDTEAGKRFEVYVEQLLSKAGIRFRAGAKYKIPQPVSSELGIGSKDSECDVIVETDDVVCLLELKKKEITAPSMAGDEVSALTDVTESALCSLTQALIHEHMMCRADGLTFTDGSKLSAGNRAVFKFHLSPFDHYGLHDSQFLWRYLRAMMAFEFTPPRGFDLEKMKKVQRRYISVSKVVMNRPVYARPERFFRSFGSFSLPQLLSILKRRARN